MNYDAPEHGSVAVTTTGALHGWIHIWRWLDRWWPVCVEAV